LQHVGGGCYHAGYGRDCTGEAEMKPSAITINPNNLPATIKAIRKNAGLTQNEIAKIIGAKSVATISHYENGHRSIPLGVLSQICIACGYDAVIKFRALQK
jgi:DNA-binding XRE family transcriptional regulator